MQEGEGEDLCTLFGEGGEARERYLSISPSIYLSIFIYLTFYLSTSLSPAVSRRRAQGCGCEDLGPCSGSSGGEERGEGGGSESGASGPVQGE
jgi:hypothetical protein